MSKLLWLCCFIVFFASGAYSATVTAVRTEKGIVKIDEGVAGGFKKGVKICFFNEDKKRLGCAKVAKSTPDYSLIRIKSKKLLARIKKGMTAELQNGAGVEASGEVTVAEGSSDFRNNLKLGYLFTAITPTKFNKLTYKAPSSASASGLDSLWEAESVTSRSLFSVIAEGEFGIGASIALAIGLRYRMFGAYEATSDYNTDPTLIEKYVALEQESSSVGIYSDFNFLSIAFTPSFIWNLSSGIDIDMPSVDFKATQKSDAGSDSVDIASYKSSMTLLSLRLGTDLTYVLSPIGLIIPGITLVVPLTSFGDKESATVNDPQAAMLSAGQEGGKADLIKSVGHVKNSFALEVLLGASIIF